jgi:hypothetical protein
MTFAVEHTIEAIGESAAITAPAAEKWVATPLRSREAEERDALLKGIAPATRKSPQPRSQEQNQETAHE